MFGDLTGRKAIKQSSRRSLLRGHIHVTHPYQRDLQLILEPPVHRPLPFCSEPSALDLPLVGKHAKNVPGGQNGALLCAFDPPSYRDGTLSAFCRRD
jgi:hypothetical protein